MAKKSKENDIEVTRFFTIFATIAAAIFHLELEKVFSKNVHTMFLTMYLHQTKKSSNKSTSA